MNTLLFVLFVLLGYFTGWYIFDATHLRDCTKILKIKTYVFKTTCDFIAEKYGAEAVKDFKIYFVEKIKEQENE